MLMTTSRECICCCEIDRISAKKEEGGDEVTCITDHVGFEPVCLNVWVLQAAYFTYRERFGELHDGNLNEYVIK